jgi:hypothetical protein
MRVGNFPNGCHGSVPVREGNLRKRGDVFVSFMSPKLREDARVRDR